MLYYSTMISGIYYLATFMVYAHVFVSPLSPPPGGLYTTRTQV